VPLYGGLMAFATNSNTIDASKISPDVIEKRLKERGIKNLKLYNGEYHSAIFKLPNFLKKLYGIK
jgi:spermidine synthase